MKISALWIAKNEAENLALSIDSLRDIVDEMIVVDTGSTDDTVKVAQELGARTAYFEWISDFSAARNYAISLATGDIIIFIDCDECFSPRLEAGDRDTLVNLFKKDPGLEAVNLKRSELDKGTGLMLGSYYFLRIFRNSPNYRYFDKIHEMLLRKNREFPRVANMPGWNLNHTGYSSAIIHQKVERNIQLLEEQLAGASNPYDRFFTQSYLMREYNGANRPEEALKYLKELLAQSHYFLRSCKDYGINYAERLYTAIMLASRFRSQFSRKDIYNRIFSVFFKAFPNYPGTVEADLYYQLLFDYREDRFLRDFDSTMSKAGKLPPVTQLEYIYPEAQLHNMAASAAWYRKEKLRAFNYAVSGLKSPLAYTPETLHILLDCMKGQQAEDIILALRGILDFTYESTIPFLISNLYICEYKALYLYYKKKQIDQGTATKGDFLYFLLLTAGCEKSVTAALEMNGGESAEMAAYHLFLTAACSGDESVFLDNAEILTPYAQILRHYFDRTSLESPTENDIQILIKSFPYIAFASNLETADRFLAVFAANPKSCFLARAEFLKNNGLYEEILSMNRGVLDYNFTCYSYIIQACIFTARYEEAYFIIKQFLDNDNITPNLLRFLSIVADNSQGKLKKDAQDLYGLYFAALDEIIDLTDVANTGITLVTDNKKQMRALGSLTAAQLKRQAAADKAAFAPPRLLRTLQRAAPVYAENDAEAMAIQCYRRLAAHGYNAEENHSHLVRLFAKAGNTGLVRELESPDFVLA